MLETEFFFCFCSFYGYSQVNINAPSQSSGHAFCGFSGWNKHFSSVCKDDNGPRRSPWHPTGLPYSLMNVFHSGGIFLKAQNGNLCLLQSFNVIDFSPSSGNVTTCMYVSMKKPI
jgi:hypothetical protein